VIDAIYPSRWLQVRSFWPTTALGWIGCSCCYADAPAHPSSWIVLAKRARPLYCCAIEHSEPSSNKLSVGVDKLDLTPLELIDRIATLLPSPRKHRHRYFGVLAQSSPQGLQ